MGKLDEFISDLNARAEESRKRVEKKTFESLFNPKIPRLKRQPNKEKINEAKTDSDSDSDSQLKKQEAKEITDPTIMKIKEIPEVIIPDSTASEDYIDAINAIMKELNGVNNLMIFADNIKITKNSLLKTTGSKSFINVNVSRSESPYLTYKKDDSSTEPYDYSFDYLLKNKNITK